MQYIFRNPVNNFEEKFSSSNAFFCCLFFGTLYFLAKGVYNHAIISAVLAIFTVGISWLIYPFFVDNILKKHFLRKGYIQVKPS